MVLNKYIGLLILTYIVVNSFYERELNPEDSCATIVITPLQDLEISANTGEKPQSKVWLHDDIWWAVLPHINGTKLWQLVDTKWVSILHLSDSINTAADIKAIDDVTHILLYQGWGSQLVSVEYNAKNRSYQLWAAQPNVVSINLERSGETATLDVDSSGRMWLASDDQAEIHVRWSDSPYKVWSKPKTLASGISPDDICALTSFPDGSVGVLWSNQITKRFGFRIHKLDTSPDNWLDDEIPASGSAISWKDGMADDHLNFAVATDGTLYAAVKTSYDTKDYPLVALLVRRPSGKWDKLYNVDDEGSRGIVLLDEEEACIMVVYLSYRDNQIVCKTSGTKTVSFSERHILMDGIYEKEKINNVTSTKQNINNEVVIMASETDIVRGVRLK